MEAPQATNAEAIVNQAFPNIDLNNFYYEIIQLSNNPIVTLSRKESVDSILKKLQDLKVKISTFSLGVSAIENVIPYLEETGLLLEVDWLYILRKRLSRKGN